MGLYTMALTNKRLQKLKVFLISETSKTWWLLELVTSSTHKKQCTLIKLDLIPPEAAGMSLKLKSHGSTEESQTVSCF